MQVARDASALGDAGGDLVEQRRHLDAADVRLEPARDVGERLARDQAETIVEGPCLGQQEPRLLEVDGEHERFLAVLEGFGVGDPYARQQIEQAARVRGAIAGARRASGRGAAKTRRLGAWWRRPSAERRSLARPEREATGGRVIVRRTEPVLSRYVNVALVVLASMWT
jgi:hypothetical protein